MLTIILILVLVVVAFVVQNGVIATVCALAAGLLWPGVIKKYWPNLYESNGFWASIGLGLVVLVGGLGAIRHDWSIISTIGLVIGLLCMLLYGSRILRQRRSQQ